MKTKKILSTVAVALTIGIFATSCEKTKTSDILDTDTSSATDNSTADNAFSGIFKSVSETTDTSSSLRSGCPTVTIASAGALGTFPKTVTIDYGTVGCNDKKGKIIANLSGPFRDSGTVITVTTDAYFHGLNQIDAGTHTITNNGTVAGHKSLSIDVAGAVITGPTGTANWATNRTLQWVAGDATPFIPADDVYLISGQSTGTNVKGVTYTASIGTPLRVAVACKWIEAGVITLTPNGKAARTIDFGTTGCDNDATVTIAGNTINVKM